jgi:hypothetical protein
MGDLNAYAKEDPIRVLIEGGMTDLHRFFHRDSSYSYTFHSEAGYLDHALCSKTLLPQVTGMSAYHLNSDESDYYTYDSSGDETMFRYSDHDPVLVGLKLDSKKEALVTVGVNSWEVLSTGDGIFIRNAAGLESPSFYRIYTVDGRLMEQAPVVEEMQFVGRPEQSGVYVVMIYYDGVTYQCKVIIP